VVSSALVISRANPTTFAIGVGFTVLNEKGYIDEWFGKP
jgi:hypothetical protein